MNQTTFRPLAILAAVAVFGALFAGCGAQNQTSSMTSSPPLSVQGTLFGSYQEADYNTVYGDNATKITLTGDSALIEGSGAALEEGIITISAPGDYLVTGSLEDGQILVNTDQDDRVHLIFENASIKNADGAALYVKQCDSLVLTLAEGSANTLTDAATYTFAEGEDEPDAALFSKADLTINGEGSLDVLANYRNGIASKDNLAIISGQITVNAVNDALRGKDSVSIQSGVLHLTAGNDGIKSNNDTDAAKGTVAIDGGTITIAAQADGIQAETLLTIGDGNLSITTGGGSVNTATQLTKMPTRSDGSQTPPQPPEATSGAPDAKTPPTPPEHSAQTADTATEDASAKGIKATTLVIHNGNFTLDCLDDALHANGDLTIHGGSFSIATDDDGLHADASATINAGDINILRCYEGIEGNTVTINDGEIRLVARDDGINAAGGSDQMTGADRFSGGSSGIFLNGGLVVVSASGDGIDANGSITQTGGTVLVNGPVSGGDSALDFDRDLLLKGGTIAAAGSAGMFRSASGDSTQPSLFVKFPTLQAAGTAVNLTDAKGTLLLSFAPSKEFETILFSSPALTVGESYTISTTPDGNGGADGYSTSNTQLGETLCTVTLSEMTTGINSDGSTAAQGQMGGHGGGIKPREAPTDGQAAPGEGRQRPDRTKNTPPDAAAAA